MKKAIYSKPEIFEIGLNIESCILSGSITGDESTSNVTTGGTGSPADGDNGDDW